MVLPSTIYGIADHDLAKTAVANRASIQIPTLIKAAVARKRAGMVGEGKAIWPNVHIDDVADLYIVLFDSIVRSPDKTGHGWEGFYFGENDEHSWYQISKAIGDALVNLEVIEDSEPTSFTADELAQYFGSEEVALSQWGTNARCHANRSRLIGWRPRNTSEDMLEGIILEVEAIVKS
ncbi:hypothetical protein C8Q80DRAFT_1214827 [Daedaleopsis nitida]|nr:hypothetical protein C8Q80DRAFT_1214827 [Daedaleopsis nitida]